METLWSDDYKRRQELMQTLEVPTISEVKLVAGLPLALVLFEECHPDLQEDFGLTPYLQGPGEELWVSPSDLLIGKVALTPPLTQKHIQALTHQGILEIGAEIEQKFLNEMRIEKEKAVQEREDYLLKMFEVQKDRLVAEAREEEQSRYAQEMDEMRLYFENKISQLLWECYEQVQQLEEQMQIEIDSLNVLWQARLEEEIQDTVEKITEEFLEKLRLQEQVLVSIFTKQIKALKMKKKCAIDFERTKCKEMMLQLRHKLHCQNIANLMYLLCKERKKCKAEKDDMENNYLSQIKKHKLNINAKSTMIKKLTRIKNKKIRQLNVRERCLIEILRQFQKFIYFALKAAPTQGEFLLNINKLIKFELEDYCIPKFQQDHQISTREAILKHSIDEIPPIIDYSENIEKFLETERSSLQDEEFEESDVLPAFYFNEKMYVREDFRDRFSTGIEIDQKNSLWNPDVEELLNIFKQSIGQRLDCQIDKVKSHHSSVHFSHEHSSDESVLSRENQILTISPQISPPSRPTSPLEIPEPLQSPGQLQELLPMAASAVNKLESADDDDEREIRKVSLGGSTSIDYKDKKNRRLSINRNVSARNSIKSQDGVIKPMGTSSMTQSRLTLARDSIILHISTMERKSIQIMSKIADETLSKISTEKDKNISTSRSTNEEIVEQTSQEIIEKQDEVKSLEDAKPLDSQESLVTDVSGKKPTTSKLLLATDSYEMIKSTIALVTDKKKVPEKSDKQKSQLTFKTQTVTQVHSTQTPTKTKKTKHTKQTKGQCGKKVATPKPATTQPIVPVARIAGSRKTKEHKKTVDEFTEERIKSLVNVMKENPSLIRLFTPCSK